MSAESENRPMGRTTARQPFSGVPGERDRRGSCAAAGRTADGIAASAAAIRICR